MVSSKRDLIYSVPPPAESPSATANPVRVMGQLSRDSTLTTDTDADPPEELESAPGEGSEGRKYLERAGKQSRKVRRIILEETALALAHFIVTRGLVYGRSSLLP